MVHPFVIHKISVGHKIRIIIEKMAKFYSFLFLCFLASFFLDAVNSAPTSSADSNSNEANNNSNAENVPNSDEPMSTENENDDNGENEIAKNDENMEDSGEPLSKEKESSENDEETNSDEYIDENGNETQKVSRKLYARKLTVRKNFLLICPVGGKFPHLREDQKYSKYSFHSLKQFPTLDFTHKLGEL